VSFSAALPAVFPPTHTSRIQYAVPDDGTVARRRVKQVSTGPTGGTWRRFSFSISPCLSCVARRHGRQPAVDGTKGRMSTSGRRGPANVQIYVHPRRRGARYPGRRAPVSPAAPPSRYHSPPRALHPAPPTITIITTTTTTQPGQAVAQSRSAASSRTDTAAR